MELNIELILQEKLYIKDRVDKREPIWKQLMGKSVECQNTKLSDRVQAHVVRLLG